MSARRTADVASAVAPSALAAVVAVALLAAAACGRRATPPREFAIAFAPSGQSSLVDDDSLDESERRIWRAAARAAAEVVGVAEDCPPVRVRFEPPPPGAGEGVLGEAHDAFVTVVASPDPLKTALRAGHECAHALLACRYGPGTLSLWLEEGLAQLAGFRAADAIARPSALQTLRVPPPEPWLDLDAILALSDYPSNPTEIAAFYWQAPALVRAIHARLGPSVFPNFLSAVADGTPPLDYLRTSCWFTDSDIDWLRRQISPGAPPPAPSSASWLL